MPSRADELAHAFDSEFARPIAVAARDAEDLLAIRIGGERYALVRGELAGLFTDRPVTPLPGGAPGLLGISGFRGALLAVYDLRAVLGVAAPAPVEDAATGDPAAPVALRWLVTAAGAPVALAFEQFDAFLRAPRDAIAAHPGGAAAGHVHRAVRTDGDLLPILDVPSIVAAIRARLPRAP